jgi:hypothetical protein
VCDAGPGTCRACQADGECTSEVCNETTGACVPEADIVYVDATTGTTSNDCGTKAAPCSTVTAGVGQVTATRKTVRVHGGNYGEAVEIVGLAVTLVGPEQGTQSAILPSLLTGKPALKVTGDAQVIVERMTLTKASGGTNADGLRCTGEAGVATPSVSLREVTISGNDGEGIDALYCTLTVRERTHISDNRGVGVSASSSTVTIDQSQVTGSGGVGVSASSSTVLTLTRSLIDKNLGGGLVTLDSSFDVVNNFIVENGKVAPGATQPGGVTLTTPGAKAIFRFNTVAANSAGAAVQGKGIHCVADPPLTLSSNIVWDNLGGDQFFGFQCSLAYSDVEQAGLGDTNLNEDPKFVDPSASNYHIHSNSPCRNKADPAGGTDVDYDSDTRQAAPYDMGADEIR